MDIIVETKDGSVIQISRGTTYIMDDGQKITYEQMMMWLIKGSLKQHGFYPPRSHTSKSYSNNNNYASRNTANLITIASVTAAI